MREVYARLAAGGKRESPELLLFFADSERDDSLVSHEHLELVDQDLSTHLLLFDFGVQRLELTLQRLSIRSGHREGVSASIDARTSTGSFCFFETGAAALVFCQSSVRCVDRWFGFGEAQRRLSKSEASVDRCFESCQFVLLGQVVEGRLAQQSCQLADPGFSSSAVLGGISGLQTSGQLESAFELLQDERLFSLEGEHQTAGLFEAVSEASVEAVSRPEL